MIDKNILKETLNDRLKEIDEFVDNAKPHDYINILINQNSSELKGYTYIDSVGLFSTLKLKGSMKYINKVDKKIRYGGLVVKIYKRESNQKWYAIIKKLNKKYYVSFDSNYIFYMETKEDLLRSWADCFISDCDKGVYDFE